MQFSVSIALPLLLAWCSLFSQVAAVKPLAAHRISNAAPNSGSRRVFRRNSSSIQGTASVCSFHSRSIAATPAWGVSRSHHSIHGTASASFPYSHSSAATPAWGVSRSHHSIHGSALVCASHSHTIAATSAQRTGITNIRHHTRNPTRGSASKFPSATGIGSLCSNHRKSTSGTATSSRRTATTKTKPSSTTSATTITAAPNSTTHSTDKTSTTTTTTTSAMHTGWANVTCDSKYATDATMDKAKRWAGAYTDDAWDAAVSYWQKKGKPAGLQFSQAISDFFNGPQEILCEDLSAENGCNDIGAHECTNFGNKAAGYFIIESFIMISSVSFLFVNLFFMAMIYRWLMGKHRKSWPSPMRLWLQWPVSTRVLSRTHGHPTIASP